MAGGADLEIRSLLDHQQYADPFGLAEQAGVSPSSWPLFGQIWPSARHLADLMQTWKLDGCRILEIGCGLALASLVVHRRNGDITASDCHPLAESFLLENLRRNDLPPMRYATGHWARENPALGCFNLIVGSDVLYERDHPQQLADFIGRHAEQATDVLIVDANRGHRPAFTRCLAAIGFELDDLPGAGARLPGAASFRDDGRCLMYRRCAA